MSDEKISLDLFGARVLTLTTEVRDLQQRFAAMETRFTALEGRLGGMEGRLGAMEIRIGSLEQRFAVQEDGMSSMLALVVRIGERLDGASR